MSTEKIFKLPRDQLWRIASQFDQAARWVDRVEKVEHLSGNAAHVGGVWRVYERWNASYRVTDLEITEWLEGERFGLRPLLRYAENVIAELYQIVFDLKTLADNQTLVRVQCEYE
ncbi:MAG: SRPBCC family protein, partial [bacterium]